MCGMAALSSVNRFSKLDSLTLTEPQRAYITPENKQGLYARHMAHTGEMKRREQ